MGDNMRFMLRLVQLLVWTVCRLLYNAITWITWQVNLCILPVTGVNTTRRQMYENPRKQVHILSVVGRFKLEEFLTFSPVYSVVNDFLLSHDRFTAEEYVLKARITLYDVTYNEAIFVETEEGVDLTHSRFGGGFMRIEQFKQARKLILMPYDNFISLGKRLGPPECRLVMLPNTGRCGLTILAQILEATNRCVAMSEPEVFASFFKFLGKVEANKFDMIISAAINILCKPVPQKTVDVFVIKPMSGHTLFMPYIDKLFPSAQFVFMYRDIVPVTKSFYKLSSSLVACKGMSMVAMKHRSLLKLVFPPQAFPPRIHHKISPTNLVQFVCLFWIRNLFQYLDYSSANMDIMAIKYEDIDEDQEFALRQIFTHFGLVYNEQEIAKAMEKDSQTGSGVSKAMLNFAMDMTMSELLQAIRATCDMCEVEVPEHNILPNTITHRQIPRE